MKGCSTSLQLTNYYCGKDYIHFNCYYCNKISNLDRDRSGGTGRPIQTCQEADDQLNTIEALEATVLGTNRSVDTLKESVDRLKPQIITEAAKSTNGERELARKFFKLSNDDEAFYKQRFQIQWLNLGDRNIKFFHISLLYRHVKNIIHWLTDEI